MPATATPRPIRTVAGVELPAAGTWRLDPGHAEVGFTGRHFMVSRVRGRFTGVTATVEIGARPEDSRVEAVIDMATVESGDRTRDDHLRSSDLFDVERHPTGTFASTELAWSGRAGTLRGDLTIKGIARPVDLAVELVGVVRDPWGADRALFTATTRIDRTDWGVDWNLPLDGGGLLVSREIDVNIDVELIHEPT